MVTRPADNAIMWRWDNTEPFGANAANDNPAGLGAFAFNLRFPGQYYDAETGKHYNYFRDYDPRIGRYIESDPIGLKGGSNTYAYVGGNPLRWIDPQGLLVDNRKPPAVGLGGRSRECPYSHHVVFVRTPHVFVESITAMCYYYCGPMGGVCPTNPEDHYRAFIVRDIVLLRFWPGNPCPPVWSFDF